MKKQTITIVIPAYNEASRLARCLDSIAMQTDRPDEVIVVNNNSTDETAAVAERYSFATLINESQQGIVYARSAGFDAAKGAILARIDADTILEPGWVAHLRDYFSFNCGAVTGSSYWHNIPCRELGRRINNAIIYHYNYLITGYYPLWGSNMAFMAADWQKVRDNVCLRNDIHEDLDLSYHLHDIGVPIFLDDDLRSGVEMRRAFESRQKLKAYTQLWPRTFKVHNQYSWPLAWGGAQFLRSTQWLPNLMVRLGRRISGLRRWFVPARH